MPIERDLYQLLYDHDCVIVPRFGGFLTHYRSARLDEQRGMVHPPGKDVSFNRHLVRTDGLLAHELGRREGLEHAKASAVVEGEVDSWKAKLERDGRLEIARIGTFYRDPEKNLQFEPDKRVNFLKDAYGLRPVPAVAFEKETPEPVVQAGPASGPEVKVIQMPPRTNTNMDEEKAPRRVPVLLTAAAVVAVFLTAGTWWVVSSQPGQDVAWSGFDVFGSSEPKQYTARVEEFPLEVDGSDTVSWTPPVNEHGIREFMVAGAEGPLVSVDLGAAPTEVKTAPAAPDSTRVATRPTGARYHIIGGCFLMKENADAFVADLQARGFAATVIDRKGGLYRVAYGSYPLKALALEALAAVRKEVAPEAWLLIQR
jgi:hypothetical protein